MPDRSADMRRRLSTLPALQLPSQPTAPSPAPPVLPVLLRGAADSEPVDLLCGSTPHNSPACLPTAALLLPAAAQLVAQTIPSGLTQLHTQLGPAEAPALLQLHSAVELPTPAAQLSRSIHSAPADNGPLTSRCFLARTDLGCTRASRPTRVHSPPTRASSRTSPYHSPTRALAFPRRPTPPEPAARSATPASLETAACKSGHAPAGVAQRASRTELPDARKLPGTPHALAATTRAHATHHSLA